VRALLAKALKSLMVQLGSPSGPADAHKKEPDISAT
jgi:hypothetical protein